MERGNDVRRFSRLRRLLRTQCALLLAQSSHVGLELTVSFLQIRETRLERRNELRRFRFNGWGWRLLLGYTLLGCWLRSERLHRYRLHKRTRWLRRWPERIQPGLDTVTERDVSIRSGDARLTRIVVHFRPTRSAE